MMIQMLLGAGSSFSFVINDLTTVTVYHAGSYIAQAHANASAIYRDDGRITDYYGVTVNNWGSPTTPGVGAAYWVRATYFAGYPPSGSALNTWLQLSGNPQWGVFQASPGAHQTTLIIQIASDSAGSNILDTHTLFLTAEVL